MGTNGARAIWVTGCYTEPNEKDQTSANLSDKSTTRIRDGPGTNRIEKCIPHQQITGISQVNIVRAADVGICL